MAARREPPSLELGAAAAVSLLESDATAGLSQAEAARRLAEHGPNVLPRERPPSAWRVLARQFKDVMVGVLLAAIALSLALGHGVEAIAIGVIAAFTIVLGSVQELRAERAIESLRQLSAPRANVVRDGQVRTIATAEVVPGDILVLAAGDVVPADARLIEGIDLQAAEAALTGESVPVAKAADARMRAAQPVGERAGMVHASTVVTYGRGRAVVTATGGDTELGRIGHLLAGVKTEPTPLQRQLARLARSLLWIGAGAVALIVVLGLARGGSVVEMLLFGMAVAVAVVPEALPAVVTISLAIGAQRMAKRNALIRRLPTVETLGGTTVICSDKTGTLTLGQMAVTRLELATGTHAVETNGYEPSGRIEPAVPPELMAEVAAASALCNDARLRREGQGWSVQGDPTEGALLVLASKAGHDPAAAAQARPRVGEVPFSSERKRMTTVHALGPARVSYTKGAPEAVLGLCTAGRGPTGPVTLTEEDRSRWLAKADQMAGAGLRVLALARGEPAPGASPEAGLALLGLVGMMDAPRPEAKAAIEVCRSAGIRPVMITGDHPRTARAVAAELGILGADVREPARQPPPTPERRSEVATGAELEAWNDADLEQRVGTVQVYARVSPAHKLRVVTALQKQGHVVAMTGDGVNDAPALRKADIGIAMGITGTDVSKEASGMMLADDNFATIVSAVEEGRAIFDNIRKYLMFLLSTNFGEILLIALTLVLGLPLPLTAVQILYVNLASDGLPALALAVDPHEGDLMRRKPRKPGQSILGRDTVLLMVLGGLVSAGANLGVFLWARQAGKPVAEAMTMVFVSLVLIQLAKAYVFRSHARSILERPFTNRWLNWACLWELGLLLLLVYVPFFEGIFGTKPMPWEDWAVIALSLVEVVAVMEVAKGALRRVSGPTRRGAATTA